MGDDGLGARESLAVRFAELLETAGLPMERVAVHANQLRPARARWKVTAKRIDDWKLGRHVPASDEAFLAVIQVLAERCAGRVDRSLLTEAAWLRLLKAARAGPAKSGGESPYPGLPPFERDQAGVFFGREDRTADLVEALRARLDDPRPLVVSGVSGAGKSSLLRAGLLAAIAAGALSEAAWPAAVLAPGLDELATALAALSGAERAAVRSALDTTDDAGEVVRQSLADAGRPDDRLVLVVDQFERIFTGDQGRPADRQAFVTALHEAAAGSSALVVLVVRSDFLQLCGEFPELQDTLQAGLFLVGPMLIPDLRRAIVRPAEKSGVRIEPGLVDRILDELPRSPVGGYEAGALPLLSEAMRATWDHHEGDRLTVLDYDESGGVLKAIQKSAETVFTGLPPELQGTARQVLHRMTAVTRDGRPARRPMPYSTSSPPDVAAVVEAFAERRLMTVTEGTAEITHDALLYAWERLRGWLEDDRRRWALYGQLLDDADEWDRQERDPSFLYRGVRLADARRAEPGWRADPDRYPTLEGAARAFLDAGVRAATRGRRRRQGLIGALAGLLVLTLVAATAAAGSARDARRQRTLAISRQLAGESLQALAVNPRQAMTLALQAWRTAATPEARSALLSAQMLGYSGELGDASGSVQSAVSPDGRLVATGGADGTITLWDSASRRPLTRMKGSTGQVSQLRFSPDGSLLASAGPEVGVWQVPDGRPVTTPRYAVGPLAFRADGTLAGFFADPRSPSRLLRLWNPRTGQKIAEFPAGKAPPWRLAFAPDGSRVAVGHGDGTADLLRAADGGKVASISGHAGPVSVAFSPGGLLATGGAMDGRVLFWNARTGARSGEADESGAPSALSDLAFLPATNALLVAGPGPGLRSWDLVRKVWNFQAYVKTSEATLLDLDVSADGRTVAASGSGGPTTLWRRSRGWLTDPDLGATMGDVTFDPSGARVAASDSQGNVRVWETASRSLRSTVSTGGQGFVGVAIGADGGLVTASGAGGVRSFAPDGGVRATFAVRPGLQAGDVALSPDGRLVAATASTPKGAARPRHEVYLWDLATRRRLGESDLGAYQPDRIIFTSDGARLLASATATTAFNGTSDNSGIVRIWSARDLKNEQILKIGAEQVTALAVSPDGRTIATAGTGREIKLWDRGGRLLHSFGQHASSIRTLAFSPDGRTLATGTTRDPTIRLWNVTTRLLHAGLTGHQAPPNTIAFSPDGRTLATAGSDGGTALWPTTPGQARTTLCRIATCP